MAGLWEFPCVQFKGSQQNNTDEISVDKRKPSADDKDMEKLMKNKCVDFIKDKFSLVVTQSELIPCGQVSRYLVISKIK